MYLEYKGNSYRSGENIIFKIRDIAISGKLYIENDHNYYICHNNIEFSGSLSSDMQGFEYSWIFHNYDGVLSDEVDILTSFTSTKKDFYISDDFEIFLRMLNKGDIVELLGISDILPLYNKISISDIKGLVLLESTETNKKVEIKIGRLLSTISNHVNILDNKSIEDIHNSYIMFQNNETLDIIKDIKGDEIVKYYDTQEYIDIRGSRLLSSCMNNRFSYLDIYRTNKAISLIAIKRLGKIVGRCLVWNLEDGRKLMDKRYTAFDWVDSIFTKIMVDDGYINFDTSEDIEIKLDNSIFDEYPYVDTFRFLCKDTKRLFNYYDNKEYKYILERTDGVLNSRKL